MTTELLITGMSCENCVRHATRAILAVDGVTSVSVTLQPAEAKVEHDSADVRSLLAALEEEGYPSSLKI